MSDTRQRWIERFVRYQTSGQTVAAFCAQEEVSVPSFYLWKRKLADTTTAKPPVPIHLIPTPPCTIELRLPSGITLRLPPDYAPHQLATLVATLEARSC